MKEYTTAELAAALNCSKRTIQDWQISRKGKPPRLPADHVDEHGNNIFTEAQLEIARAFTDRTKKKNSQGQTLFDTGTPADKTQDTHEEIVGDVVDSDEPAQVTDTDAPSTKLITPLMTSLEEMHNGNVNAVKTLRGNLKKFFGIDVEAEKLIALAKSTGDFRDDFRKFIAQYNIIFTDYKTGELVKLVRQYDGTFAFDSAHDSDGQLIETSDDDATQAHDQHEQQSSPVTDTTAKVVTLDQRAARIRQLQADVQRGMIEIGFELIAAKAEIGHGGWQKWLDTEFEWTDRTARYFMAVAERFGNRNTYSDLKPSTLKVMLALPAGDEDEFVAAMEAAGTPVNKQSARELQQSVATWKKRNETHEPPPVESHAEDSDAGKLFVGGKPLDSVVAIVPVDRDEGENARDDASEGNQPLEQNPAPVTTDNASKTFDKVTALHTATHMLNFVVALGWSIKENQLNSLVKLFGEYFCELQTKTTDEGKLASILKQVIAVLDEINRDLTNLAEKITLATDKLKAEATEKDSNQTEDK